MRHARYATWARRWRCLLGLSMALPLVGCPSTYWTNPTKAPTAFAEDAITCEREAAQAPTSSDVLDADHYQAYLACLRGMGWELQQRP